MVREHLTTDLNATVWMPLLDTEHAVTVASDGRRQVLSSPLVPGLSIIVPRGARLVDEDGHPVRQLTISPVPVDRPPFPTPAMGPRFPTYFTVQPAGIRVVGGEARVIYPNPTGRPPGTQAQFWSYEADEGWESYGTGTVTRDGRSIIPVAGLRELVPAALYEYPGLPANGPIDGQDDPGHGPEPVDLATGLYWYDATDLELGAVDGLRVTRTYRTNDATVRLFGVGSNPWWALALASTSKDEYADLLMPNGTPIRFDAVMSPFGQYWEARSTPGELLGARLRFADASDPVEAGNTFVLNLRDGRRLLFTHSTLTGIVELDGRTTQFHSLLGTEDGPTDLARSSDGHWIRFSYDLASHTVITRATDDLGRTVTYRYDAAGHLVSTTDPEGGVTSYTYDATGNLASLTGPRGIRFILNEYDAAGRIVKQTQADGGIHAYTYTMSGDHIAATDYTDPDGSVRHVEFDDAGYVVTVTWAAGLPEAETMHLERDPLSHRVLASVDALGRRTEYSFDSAGRMLSQTRLAGTPDAVTESWRYASAPGGPVARIDALGHETRYRARRGAITSRR